MSHLDPQVGTEYRLSCRDCDFVTSCDTAGTAEAVAMEHVNQIIDYHLANYDHTVDITVVTTVSRN